METICGCEPALLHDIIRLLPTVSLFAAALPLFLHSLYLLSLVCFSRMVSRMPLSLLDAEGQRNFFMLERVLQVMAPLLRVVDELSWTFRAWYPAALATADQSLLATAASQFGPATPVSPSPRGPRSPRSSRSKTKLGTPKNNNSINSSSSDRSSRGGGVAGECHLMSIQVSQLRPPSVLVH